MILAFSDFRPAETGIAKMKKAFARLQAGIGSFPTSRSSLRWRTVAGMLSLRKEVILLMIEIEGVQYDECGHCLHWFPTDEMRWDDEILSFVCWDADSVSFVVV